MAWVKLTPARATNRKLRRAGLAARGLDEAAMCQSCFDMTDGHISRDTVETLALMHGEKRWERLVDLLVEVGRWTPNGDGWHIHDYLEFNWSKEQLEAEIEKKRNAGRKGGLARAKADAQARATAPAKPPGKASATADAQANSTQLRSVSVVGDTHEGPGSHPQDQDQELEPPTHKPEVHALIERWLNTVDRPSPLSRADADRWIPHLATILATEVIDTLIGQAAEQTPAPRNVKYLVASCRQFAAQHLPGTSIPDPPDDPPQGAT